MNGKNYFTLCLIFLIVAIASISTTYAQTSSPGEKILKDISQPFDPRDFDLNRAIAEGAKKFSEQAGIPELDAKNILKDVLNLKDSLKIDIPSGGKLLDGIISGKIPKFELPEIKGMLDELKKSIASPKIIKDLVNKIGLGTISPQIGEILGGLKDLGKIESLKDLEEIFKNPKIIKELKDIILKGGIPSEVAKAITDITKIVGDIEKLKELGSELIAKELSKILPPELIALLGTNWLNFLMLDLSTIIGDTPPFEPGEPATGDYEIPDTYDAHSDPVDKECEFGCTAQCTCKAPIESNHIRIRKHVSDEFVKHRSWFIDELFTKHVLPAMALMTSQLQTVFVQQTLIIGTFFDAEHQIKKHRLLQEASADAHRDYQVSAGLCDIGTGVRSLTASQQKQNLAQTAFANYAMDRQLRNSDTSAAASNNSDINNRISNFTQKYCNKADNANGLNFLCKHGGENKARMNKDVDFTRTLESPLTLDIDFSDSATAEDTADKEDIFALSANLFAHEPLPAIAAEVLATPQGKPKAMAHLYMDLRSIAAKRSVAQNSFSAIVAEHIKGDGVAAPYLKKAITELGVPDEEVEGILGKNPSSLAQKAVLQQKLYQNPVFYTELYDKPANVLRKGVALRAISLMQERDIFESQLRSEMALAVILETMLREDYNYVNGQLIALEEGDE